MADFLEEKKREIAARLKELRPLVDEYHRLEAAQRALEGVADNGGRPATRARRRGGGGALRARRDGEVAADPARDRRARGLTRPGAARG